MSLPFAHFRNWYDMSNKVRIGCLFLMSVPQILTNAQCRISLRSPTQMDRVFFLNLHAHLVLRKVTQQLRPLHESGSEDPNMVQCSVEALGAWWHLNLLSGSRLLASLLDAFCTRVFLFYLRYVQMPQPPTKLAFPDYGLPSLPFPPDPVVILAISVAKADSPMMQRLLSRMACRDPQGRLVKAGNTERLCPIHCCVF